MERALAVGNKSKTYSMVMSSSSSLYPNPGPAVPVAVSVPAGAPAASPPPTTAKLNGRRHTSVAELAHRFLEENVRNCIKPRIFPMESTSAVERVPTPFVFASDIYLRRQHRAALALTTTRMATPEYDFLDRILHRATVYDFDYGSSQETRMNSPGRKHRDCQNHRSDFASTLKKWSAPIPPVLLRKLGRVSDSPLGKVKVMLKVCDVAEEVNGTGILGIDQRKKQVTLIDPGGNASGPTSGITPEERRVGVSAPKMFAFDGIFGQDDDQSEICAASGAELVASVLGGEDGCFVSLGYCTQGKKQTMFGRPANLKMGVVPTTVSWLFKCIHEQKQKTGSRFSVRVSAVEVTGGSGHEAIHDLLLPFAKDGDQPPGAYLSDSTGGSSGAKNSSCTAPILNTMSEVRAPNAETAGFYLDAALDAMSKEDPIRHFVFTLHVYQYTVDKNGKGAVVGGRSRLHCVMLGNGSPSISVLGGLLLAVLNGQRHLPSRDSKLGAILRECLGSLTCRAVVMIHVSNAHSRYAETLAALQLGSRVHRLRRSRRLKMGSVGSGNGSGGSSGGSGEEMRLNCTNAIVALANNSLGGLGEGETGSSDIDPSSSEQSCDTVIYLGPSIDDATDGEHPPVYLPSLENGSSSENGKCPLNGGPPPKTKSPKPKSSKEGSNFSSGNKSEEKWVDGPKVSKYRQLPNGVGGGHGSPAKKSETWIDGPAARVHHQGNNFPSPKKQPQNHKMRGITDTSLSCAFSSTKAQMIQNWISNQTHSFLDDSSPHDSGVCMGSSDIYIPTGPHGLHTAAAAALYSNGPSVSNAAFLPPRQHHQLAAHSTSQPYSFYSGSISFEPEYKALTVFKTCDDLDDNETIHGESLPNGFEFELIEVVEPEVPVPTCDACLQVTEEDIALSFLEVEENPLPESDQNLSMGSENYFSSSGNNLKPQNRGRSTSFSSAEGSLQDLERKSLILEKNEDHPLRVLSQECLTVVSTFTDSMSIAGGDIERFWPRLSFDMTACRDIHEVGMCHGLCKNLVSLSQMSLNHQTTNGEGHGSPNDENQTVRNGDIVTTFVRKDIKSSVSMEAKNSKQVIKSPCKGTSMGLPLPALSDESIFKVPKSPLSGSTVPGSQNGYKSKGKDQSDAEQETISIPPMKLLDLTPIRNNGSHPSGMETTPGSNANLSENSSSCENGRANRMSCVSPPGNNVQSKGHRGCDHNHHFSNGNGNVTNTPNPSTASMSGNPSNHSPQPVAAMVMNGNGRDTPPSPIPELTKSPSKSKSRKIAKFFRSRSKSPKTAAAVNNGGVTSSSESGKSSVGSDKPNSKLSSSSSCSSGSSSTVGSKPPKSSCLSSPSKKKSSGSLLKLSTMNSNGNHGTDYQFTCDSTLPMFAPTPGTLTVGQKVND